MSLSPTMLGRFSLGRDPTLLFQFVHSRLQRSVTHLQHVAGDLFPPLTDAEAIHRLKSQNLQQHVQRAPVEIGRFAHYHALGNRG